MPRHKNSVTPVTSSLACLEKCHKGEHQKTRQGGQGWRHRRGAWASFLGSPGTINSDSIYSVCLYTTPSPSPSSAISCLSVPSLQTTGSVSLRCLLQQERLETAQSWDSSHVLLESDVRNRLPCWLPVFLTLWPCRLYKPWLSLFNTGGIPHPTLRPERPLPLTPALWGCGLHIRWATCLELSLSSSLSWTSYPELIQSCADPIAFEAKLVFLWKKQLFSEPKSKQTSCLASELSPASASPL